MLHLPGGVALFPEFSELADKITNGDGLVWTGDPRLYLAVGVVTHKPTGRTARRLEVRRLCEDGTDQIIGHWHLGEAFRICHDLAEMRLGRPGAVSAEARIDKHNAKLEEDARAKSRDSLAQMLERRAYQLVRMQGHAKTSFAVNGRRDAPE